MVIAKNTTATADAVWVGAPGRIVRARKFSESARRFDRIVSVLFARADSAYKTLPGCDVWDKDRNAMLCDDDWPVVAHPPCRAWGRLRTFANPEPGERNTARLAVALVRKNGGVLEHPQGSGLWADQWLPIPGARDQYGGWTLPISQMWWGHKAEKKTGCISWAAILATCRRSRCDSAGDPRDTEQKAARLQTARNEG